MPLDLTADHLLANGSALGHYEAFKGHRERLTALVAGAAPPGALGSLCVLGAGNAFDLDLERLAQDYREVCLVDIDEAAVTRAVSRQSPVVRSKLRLAAPVDLSGLLHAAERWARFEVTAEEVAGHATKTARQVCTSVGATFDVVASTCIASQMQLDVVRAFGDRHPLFKVASWTLIVTHLRTLGELTKSGGKALLANDVTAAPLYPVDEHYGTNEGLTLLEAATRAGKIFDFADPRRIRGMLADDPYLKAAFPSWEMADAWVWQNGPTTRFLVYGAVLQRA